MSVAEKTFNTVGGGVAGGLSWYVGTFATCIIGGAVIAGVIASGGVGSLAINAAVCFWSAVGAAAGGALAWFVASPLAAAFGGLTGAAKGAMRPSSDVQQKSREQELSQGRNSQLAAAYQNAQGEVDSLREQVARKRAEVQAAMENPDARVGYVEKTNQISTPSLAAAGRGV